MVCVFRCVYRWIHVSCVPIGAPVYLCVSIGVVCLCIYVCLLVCLCIYVCLLVCSRVCRRVLWCVSMSLHLGEREQVAEDKGYNARQVWQQVHDEPVLSTDFRYQSSCGLGGRVKVQNIGQAPGTGAGAGGARGG